MNKIIYSLLFAIIAMTYTSCNDVETYAEMRDAERASISDYIARNGIKVISEEEFLRDTTTDVSQNEYVLFNASGVYMQIIHRGCGEMIKKGETCHVLSRFTESKLNGDSSIVTNQILTYAHLYDKYTVSNTSGSFNASFDATQSLMYRAYGSASVPGGWLVPLSYVKIGRLASPEDEIAKVKLIVPHDQGHQIASQNVYACVYTITYQRGDN